MFLKDHPDYQPYSMVGLSSCNSPFPRHEVAEQEPSHYRQVHLRSDSKQWETAMQDEMESIRKSGTWDLTPLPAGRKAIGSRWVYKLKRKADGSIDRYKARLVAQGYSQLEGIDYTETYAPTAKFCSMRALLALAASQDLELHQMDVKTAFLNGDLEEEIYMKQPEGFAVSSGPVPLVCKLKKSLYGLKQSPRAWYQKMDQVLLELGFHRSEADHCIYSHKDDKGVRMYIGLYVDDLFLLSSSLDRLTMLKRDLGLRFDMKDLGEAQYILGFQIVRDRSKRQLTICQSGYIQSVLERFNMHNCNPASTPMLPGTQLLREQCPVSDQDKAAMASIPYQSALGAVMYAMLGTRPDIAYAVSCLSKFSSNPGRAHWSALKHLLRYLRGTIDFKLTYGGLSGSDSSRSTSSALGSPLVGYSDSDWGSDPNDRRSISGYVFQLAGGAVSWQAKKQDTVALSSVEAEYMASTQATKEALWWRTFFEQIGMPFSGPTRIWSDNQGSIALIKNPQHHARTKHIDIRYHFIRQHVSDRSVEFVFKGTEFMAADIFTKSLPRHSHQRMLQLLGVTS